MTAPIVRDLTATRDGRSVLAANAEVSTAVIEFRRSEVVPSTTDGMSQSAEKDQNQSADQCDHTHGEKEGNLHQLADDYENDAESYHGKGSLVQGASVFGASGYPFVGALDIYSRQVITP